MLIAGKPWESIAEGIKQQRNQRQISYFDFRAEIQ